MLPEDQLRSNVSCTAKRSTYSGWFPGRRLSGLMQPESGQTLVEVAMTFSILIMVVIGIMQAGMALHAYDTVADAARSGSRYAIVHGSTCTGCVATSASVQTYVQNLGLQIASPSTVSVTTTWPDTGSSCTPSVVPCNNKGNNVKVKVTYPFQMQIPFVRSGLLTLSSTSEMVISQ
jgi:Flp pilus assembly protein TadG